MSNQKNIPYSKVPPIKGIPNIGIKAPVVPILSIPISPKINNMISPKTNSGKLPYISPLMALNDHSKLEEIYSPKKHLTSPQIGYISAQTSSIPNNNSNTPNQINSPRPEEMGYVLLKNTPPNNSNSSTQINSPASNNSNSSNQINSPASNNSNSSTRINSPISNNSNSSNQINSPTSSNNSNSPNQINSPVSNNSNSPNQITFPNNTNSPNQINSSVSNNSNSPNQITFPNNTNSPNNINSPIKEMSEGQKIENFSLSMTVSQKPTHQINLQNVSNKLNQLNKGISEIEKEFTAIPPINPSLQSEFKNTLPLLSPRNYEPTLLLTNQSNLLISGNSIPLLEVHYYDGKIRPNIGKNVKKLYEENLILDFDKKKIKLDFFISIIKLKLNHQAQHNLDIIYKDFLTSMQNNLDTTNYIFAHDVLCILSDIYFFIDDESQEDFLMLLNIQFEDMDKGKCPSGRVSRLMQIVSCYVS